MSSSYSPPRCASIRRDDGRPRGTWPELGSDCNDEDSAKFFGCRLVTQKTDLGKPCSVLALGLATDPSRCPERPCVGPFPRCRTAPLRIEAGLEPSVNYPRKTGTSTKSDAKSDALSADLPILADPDLASLVAAWPNLNDKLKVKILQLATRSSEAR
jgi:hypothetical protein